MLNNPVEYKEWGDVDYVAVYGTLRKNNGNHRLIDHLELKSIEKAKGFGMVSCGGFPAAYKSADKEIVIEVYKISSQHDKENCDGLEGYRDGGQFYDRVLIDTSLGKAWIYIQDRTDESDRQVESGDWMEGRSKKWDLGHF